jgi:hypothetical protein
MKVEQSEFMRWRQNRHRFGTKVIAQTPQAVVVHHLLDIYVLI